MTMETYLDNAATTRVAQEVKALMIKLMDEDYGNPSSLHHKGVVAENYIKEGDPRLTDARTPTNHASTHTFITCNVAFMEYKALQHIDHYSMLDIKIAYVE